MQDQRKTKTQLLKEIAELRQEVSRLKQSEEEIRTSEAKFRTLYESTSDAVMVLDETGFLDCNNATLKVFGYDSFDQFINTHPSEQSPPTQPDGQASNVSANEKIATAMQEGTNSFEWVHRRADGTPFPAEVLLTAMKLEGHQVLQAVVRDITKRRQAEQTLTKQAAQMAALNQLILAVLDQTDPLSVYRAVTQVLVNYFDMSFARIWILEQETNDLVLQASSGEYTHTDGPHGRVSMDSDRKLAWIAKQRTPHISNDLLNDPRVDDKVWVKESNTVAFAGYPLLAGDNLLGVLGMFSHQPIPQETQSLLQSLVVLLDTFVNTQRLFSRLEARAQELETVAQVSTAASTILDADKLLQEVADLTKTRFGLYHAHIYQLNEAQDTLVLAAGAGEVGRQMVAEGWSIPATREKSLVARAARTRQGVIVNDVRQEPDWLPNPLLPNTRSEMAVPMIVGDRVLGVLDVQASRAGHFSNEGIHIQTTLATQVGVALQNAELFQQTQQSGELLRKRVEELNAMTDIGREIAESPPIAELLDWVTSRIPLAMQYPDVCKVAIKYRDNIYGDSKAVDLPAQIVHALRVGNEVVGRIYVAYTQKYDFLNEESALLGGTANRLSSYIESRNLFDQIQTALDQVQRLAAIVENHPDFIGVGTMDGKAIYVNPAGLRMMDLPPDHDITQMDAGSFYQPADVERLANEGLPTALSQGSWTAEVNLLKTDGTTVPVETTIGINYDTEGNPTSFSITMRDITGRRQTNEALRESEERTRTILESVTVPLLISRVLDGQILYANTPLGDTLQVAIEELIGQQTPDFYYELADKEEVIGLIQNQGYIDDYELQIKQRGGQALWALLSARLISFQGESAIFITLLDITERKQSEAEREKLLEDVQASYRQFVVREWGQFLTDQHQGNMRIEHGQSIEQDSNSSNGQSQIDSSIALRGQVIGSLSLQDIDPNRKWSDEEQALVDAVSEQLAQTVENLRLFENTQQRASRERLTREITDKMRAAPNVETIIKAGLEELSKALGVSRTYVKLSPDIEENE